MTRQARADRSDSNSDAKLIALGNRLVEIQKRLRPVRAEHWRLGDEAHNYAYRLTGWEPDPANPPELYDRYAEPHKEMAVRIGFDACDKRLEAPHRELDPIMREIMDTPATSISGLRVKTLAAIESNGQLWHERHRDLDWDVRAVRSLIEAACAVAGVPVPKETPVRTVADDGGNARSHPSSAALN